MKRLHVFGKELRSWLTSEHVLAHLGISQGVIISTLGLLYITCERAFPLLCTYSLFSDALLGKTAKL